MACLANTVQANPDSFYFALSGSEGPGASLQSPANVIPAANGTVNLNMVASTGVGDATLTISSTNGNNAALDLVSTAGGNTYITMGEALGDKVAILNSSGTSGVLAITNDSTSTPFFLVDTVNNNVSVGALSGGGVAVGTVTIQEALIIRDGAAGIGNSLGLSPTSPGASVISQTVASAGILNLGSSLANPAGLSISDIALPGQFNYTIVNGTSGNPGLVLQGAQGGAGICGIRVNAVAGSGSLVLGSDNTNTGLINITNTATTVNNLGGAPQVLLAQQNLAPGATGTIPTPTGEGLYCIMGCSAGPGSSGQSRQAQVNVMAYVNSSGRIQMGGSGIADIGSVGGTDAFILIPIDGSSTMFYQNNGSQSVLNYSIQAFKISGPILGTI